MESEYIFETEADDKSHEYLYPAVVNVLQNALLGENKSLSVLDLGCGNGSMLKRLARAFPNCHFVGADPSPSAQRHHNVKYMENIKFIEWSEFISNYKSKFDIILSVEVIEHVYLPREYVKLIKKHLNLEGTIVVTTPYHGYVKNLVLALTGKLDAHFTALWDYGHIKFWSIRTLKKLFLEFHFTARSVMFCGRFYPLSKSFVVVFQRQYQKKV